MFTHEQFWQGIEQLAVKKNLSMSGLALKAGLDSTCFNPSKKFTPTGQPRWISTESLQKTLKATNTKLSAFAKLVEN